MAALMVAIRAQSRIFVGRNLSSGVGTGSARIRRRSELERGEWGM
jgi:hypothetical protein